MMSSNPFMSYKYSIIIISLMVCILFILLFVLSQTVFADFCQYLPGELYSVVVTTQTVCECNCYEEASRV